MRLPLVGKALMSSRPASVSLNSISCSSCIDHNGHSGMISTEGLDLIFGLPDLAILRKDCAKDSMKMVLLNEGTVLISGQLHLGYSPNAYKAYPKNTEK